MSPSFHHGLKQKVSLCHKNPGNTEFMDRLCLNHHPADLNHQNSPLLTHGIVGRIFEEDCNGGWLELEA